MAQLRQFNTRAKKLSTAQVQEMYGRLLNGETQGSLAREYGLSVIQVGRIARGESRAQETGAHNTPVPNFNMQIRPSDIEASEARLRALLAAEPSVGKAPSLYEDPPPYEDDTNSSVLELLQTAIDEHPLSRVGEELDKLKGD